MRYWLSLLLIGLAVASADLVLLGTETPHWSIDALVGLTTGYATLWYASRVRLAWRFQQGDGNKFMDGARADAAEIVGLPAQDKALSELKNMLMPPGARDGRLVSLKAPWGGGKTVLLRLLQEQLDASGDHVPVWINVWAVETEAELHRAFYEKLLNTPAVFEECWLALPWLTPSFSLLLRRVVRSVRIAFRNGGLEAEATLHADMPLALTVQPQIEWIVGRLRRQGKAPVVILEEIDRATPVIAKLAITAAQRSFNLPGVTVVLPYVEEHLWTKVFNPLDPAPADLDSTVETLLHLDMEHASRMRSRGLASTGDEEVPPPEYLGLYAAKPIPQAQEANSPRPLDVRAPLAVWRRYRLHRHFASLPATHQTRLLRRFSEKYLGGYQVEMQSYGAKDIAALVTGKSSLFRMTRRAFPALASAGETEARQAVQDAIGKYHGGIKVERLRHFEHYYVRLLERDPGGIAEIPAATGTGALEALLADQDIPPDSAAAELIMAGLRRAGFAEAGWPMDCAARAVAALAALAAWYAAVMMSDEEA